MMRGLVDAHWQNIVAAQPVFLAPLSAFAAVLLDWYRGTNEHKGEQ